MNIAKTAGKNKGTGFFCVSLEHIEALTKTEALTFCAYLVMACGTGGDNTTTAWSAKAISKYCGCRWQSADKAVLRLIELGIVERDLERSGPRSPKYRILNNSTVQDSPVWLPKTLVEGVTKTPPYPLTALREVDDPLLVRLLMDLYCSQNLVESGGIDPAVLRAKFDGEMVGESGAVRAWRFVSTHDTATDTISQIHLVKRDWSKFWERLRLLQALNLVERAWFLMNKEGGEPLAAFGMTQEEGAVYRKLYTYALHEVCKSSIFKEETPWILPVMAHIKEPFLQGLFRLKYRPHTKLTAAWWGNNVELNNAYLARFGLEDKKEVASEIGSTLGNFV